MVCWTCAEDVFPEQSQVLALTSDDASSPECVQQAEVLVAEANRTLAQARSAVASTKQNRSGFLPPSNVSPSRKGKGKGKVKGKSKDSSCLIRNVCNGLLGGSLHRRNFGALGCDASPTRTSRGPKPRQTRQPSPPPPLPPSSSHHKPPSLLPVSPSPITPTHTPHTLQWNPRTPTLRRWKERSAKTGLINAQQLTQAESRANIISHNGASSSTCSLGEPGVLWFVFEIRLKIRMAQGRPTTVIPCQAFCSRVSVPCLPEPHPTTRSSRLANRCSMSGRTGT